MPQWACLADTCSAAAEGQVVSPEQVIGPDQLGRKIAILGTTSSPGDAVQWAQQAHTVVAAVPVCSAMQDDPITGT